MVAKLTEAMQELFGTTYPYNDIFTDIIVISLFVSLLYAFTFWIKPVRQSHAIFWLYIFIIGAYILSYFGLFANVIL
jgi:hypothetical protein